MISVYCVSLLILHNIQFKFNHKWHIGRDQSQRIFFLCNINGWVYLKLLIQNYQVGMHQIDQ